MTYEELLKSVPALTRRASGRVLGQPLLEGRHQPGEGDADLRHFIARADGDRLVVDRLEVDGDRKGRADLVLAPVALADRLRIVVLGPKVWSQLVLDLFRQLGERLLARERQHRDLDRRDGVVELQDHAAL